MTELLERLRNAVGDRYSVERELGRGGMATVFAALDRKHQRQVAIKVLTPELAAQIGPDRFLREIEIAAGLRHPHILPLFDSGNANGLLYYVMPLVEGESLRDRLTRERQLPVLDAVRIADQVASALAYAHSRGVIHRDIKPENILLESGQAVVADFGIARAVDAAGGRLTETGMAVGTPAYMSPEQALGEGSIDARSDIYALGIVTYEMLAGDPPFTGPTAQAIVSRRLTEAVPSLRLRRETTPLSVEIAVTKALARAPADRFATATQFAEAMADQGAAVVPVTLAPPRRLVSGWRWVALLAGGMVIVAGLAAVLRRTPTPKLDLSLLAVAPFDVLDPRLALWREGLVDILSRSLDGAGPLKTVSPTVVMHRWTGRATRDDALRLAHRAGAGLAVFGALVPGGKDSVSLQVSLLDAATEKVLAEVELRDLSERMDRLADSLTVALLRELGRTRPIGAVRRTGFGSNSLPAIKAFLQGEQFLRRTEWDSALAWYDRALALDSAFSPALRRAGLALAWIGRSDLSEAYFFRAARFNRGLAPRDSLLATADSLLASLVEAGTLANNAPPGWRHGARRLIEMLAAAAQRYPDDPEIWFQLGEARMHIGLLLGESYARVLQAFDHAIELDPAFAPAYIHPIEILLRHGDIVKWQAYSRAFLALNPGHILTDGVRLAAALIDPAAANTAVTRRVLDTISAQGFDEAKHILERWKDSSEVMVEVLRERIRRLEADQTAGASPFQAFLYAQTLLYRGHLQDAAKAAWTAEFLPNRFVIAEVGMLNGIGGDSMKAYVARVDLPRMPVMVTARFLPWMSGQRDTAGLLDVHRRMEGITRTHPRDGEGVRAAYIGQAATAYLTLARGDSAEALSRFLSLPDSLCIVCFLDRLKKAELLIRARRAREADSILRPELPTATTSPFASEILWELLRARAADQLGARDRAAESYQMVLQAWRKSDPVLQPFVSEARDALQRLGAEPMH